MGLRTRFLLVTPEMASRHSGFSSDWSAEGAVGLVLAEVVKIVWSFLLLGIGVLVFALGVPVAGVKGVAKRRNSIPTRAVPQLWVGLITCVVLVGLGIWLMQMPSYTRAGLFVVVWAVSMVGAGLLMTNLLVSETLPIEAPAPLLTEPTLEDVLGPYTWWPTGSWEPPSPMATPRTVEG